MATTPYNGLVLYWCCINIYKREKCKIHKTIKGLMNELRVIIFNMDLPESILNTEKHMCYK